MDRLYNVNYLPELELELGQYRSQISNCTHDIPMIEMSQFTQNKPKHVFTI